MGRSERAGRHVPRLAGAGQQDEVRVAGAFLYPSSMRDANAELYLDLLKMVLTRSLDPVDYVKWSPARGQMGLSKRAKSFAARTLGGPMSRRNLEIMKRVPFDPEARATGTDWPVNAETMIGLDALDVLRSCVDDVLDNDVPGDLVETGAWRGGASIYMRAILKVRGDTKRTVWVADSFEGLPKPDDRYPQDAGDEHWTVPTLTASLEEVQTNFERYGMLDEQVRFLVGWFKDTLPSAPIDEIAVLRVDADMYGSTMDALEALGHKVSPGGYVIVDDYSLTGARAAIHDYRDQRGITARLHPTGVRAYWQQPADPG